MSKNDWQHVIGEFRSRWHDSPREDEEIVATFEAMGLQPADVDEHSFRLLNMGWVWPHRAHRDFGAWISPGYGDPAYCSYCGAGLDMSEGALERVPTPATGDNTAWERLALQHNPGCEWTSTRAHRIGVGV